MVDVLVGDEHDRAVEVLGFDPLPDRLTVVRVGASKVWHTTYFRGIEGDAACGISLVNAGEAHTDGWLRWRHTNFCKKTCGYLAARHQRSAKQVAIVIDNLTAVLDGSAEFSTVDRVATVLFDMARGRLDGMTEEAMEPAQQLLLQVAERYTHAAWVDPRFTRRRIAVELGSDGAALRTTIGELLGLNIRPGSTAAVKLDSKLGTIATSYAQNHGTDQLRALDVDLDGTGVSLGRILTLLDARTNRMDSSGPLWAIPVHDVATMLRSAGYPWAFVNDALVAAVPAGLIDHLDPSGATAAVIGPVRDPARFTDQVAMFAELYSSRRWVVTSDDAANLWDASARLT